MPINYKVKQLYDALKEDGADVGSEQEFNDWFFKPGDEGYKNRRSVYDAFKEDGADIGKDYGEFAGWLGLHAVEAQKQSPALTQDVRRPQAPLPQAATSVHAAAQKPAKPQPVQRQQTAQQPVTYFRLRRGGKDFNVSADEVRKAGGLQAWANRHPGAPVRVYMQGNGFNGHVDLSQAHNRYAKQGYKYSTTTAKTPVKAMSRPEKQPTVKPAEQPMTDMQKEMLLDNLQGIVNNARSSNTRTIQQMKNKLEYDKKSRNGFLGGPVEGGVQYNPSTGKMEQTYLTPQGYKTTSKGDADMMSQQYREQQAFRQRMKVNGLKPDNKEDVQKQMQLDEEKPMRDVLNDVWGEAEAQDKKAQEAWRNRADKNARGFSLSDAAAASSSAGAVFAGRGEDFNNDLEYQKKRHAIFDFDKMANTMYARLPEDYRRGTLERYTDYFKKHPKDAKGKTAAIAAKDALMGDLYRQVYERAKAQDMPKSKLEFLLRKIADQPLISSSMAANTVAAWQTGSHGLDLAEQDAMSTFGKQHKTLDIAGTVANMALDPVTYAAGGVGGVVGKKALKAVGKQALKGATKKVAERYAAGTLAGRVAQGAAGGAANFGTFNTVKGIQQQMAVGGTLDENGKPTNELSAGDILKETAHGLMLGAATGTLSPLIGNVADKAVKATSSTAGKVALRAGQTALSTLAEGTVFAIPDMVDKGKWDWDTWTDSQAMMLGFKASHAIKSAPRVLQGLQREDRRIGLNFEERLRKQLDASPADIGFKPEEMEELRDKGYTGLSMLFRDANKRKAYKSTGIEERTDDYENLTPDRFDGYEAMKRLMNDNSVSEATRAKAYYILTGHMLPMSSVVGYDVEKDDAGRVTVNSVNARGGVVTTRRFANEKAAGQEIDNIARQAELNAVNVGEKYKETASNIIVMEQAIKEVAPDADVATVLNNYKMVKSGQLTDEAYVRQAQAIDEAIARNRHIADPNRPEAIREKIKKETGIDVDASLRKMPAKRTEKEQAVVDEYIRSLFPEEKAEKPNNGGYEQIEPDAHYNRGYKSADDESGDEMRRVKTDYDTKRNGMADKYGEDNLAAIDDDPIGWLDANADKMSDEDAHVVTDYVNARYAYLGMTQRANDDADDAAVSAAAAVDARANKDDNMVHPATLKDGGNVYIVSGNVVMSADGKSVDKGKSSKRIVVRDAQSGEMSMLPADDVIALDAPIDAQQERDAAAKAAAEQSRTASANAADGLTTHDNPQLGDEVYVRGDDGKPVRGIIRNVDSYTGDYMVETEAPIAGKKAQPFKAEQLYDRVQDDTDADTVADMGSNAIDTTIPTPDDSQSQPQQQQNSGETSTDAEQPETPAQPEDETEHQPQTEELQGSEQTAEVGQPASESEEAHTGETPARAIDKIPSEQVTDKKGNTRTVHHWEQAPAEDTYDAMTQDVFDGDAKAADDYANGMAKRLDKEIKKLDKEIAKSTTGESLDDILEAKKRTQKLRDQREALQQRKKYWQNVRNVPVERNRAKAEDEARAAARAQAEAEANDLASVPEWGEDTPQAARDREFRRESDHKIERQKPLKATTGNEVDVRFSQKDVVKGKVAVVDASQLQASHVNRRRNPRYFLDEAQPKERTDEASLMASHRIAQDVRPAEITGSATAYSGAPVVNTRGEVIQGNNRTDVLKRMYDEDQYKESAEKYKQYLMDHAEEFGLNPEDIAKMKHPVLVNMVDVSDEEAIRLGQMSAADTESGGVERIRPQQTRQKMDDRQMGVFLRILLNDGNDQTLSISELIANNGIEAVKYLHQIGAISDTQMESAVSNGALTDEAKTDIKNLLFETVFHGAPTTLREIFNSMPKAAQRAILATAWRDASSDAKNSMIGEIQKSIYAWNDMRTSFGEELKASKSKENTRLLVGNWMQQLIFNTATGQPERVTEKYSNFAIELATRYFTDKQTELQDMFNALFDQIQGTSDNLFDPEGSVPKSLGEAIKKVLGIDYKPLNKKSDVNRKRQTGSNGVDRNDKKSEGGQSGSAGDTEGGEQGPQGARAADSGRGTKEDATGRQPRDLAEAGNGTGQRSGSEEVSRRSDAGVRQSGQAGGLNEQDADAFLSKMEDNAVEIPNLELNPANWLKEFGEDGVVTTPIAEVKMGANQIAKLFEKGRSEQFGMIKPTLEHPLVIIEVPSNAVEGETERGTSWLFVKTFLDKNGEKIYYFKSVTVKKDGLEVSVSSHFDRSKRIKDALIKGKLLYRFDGGAQTEHRPADVSVTASPESAQGNKRGVWRTPKDAAASSAEKQGLDYEQPNEAEAATKGSGITPQSTPSAGKNKKTSDANQGKEKKSSGKSDEVQRGKDEQDKKKKEGGKIEDAGEKIEGAKKDWYKKYMGTVHTGSIEDIIKEPLSKILPRPDFKKMKEVGASDDGIAILMYIFDHLPAKPRTKYKMEQYVQDIQAAGELVKMYFHGGAQHFTLDDFIKEAKKVYPFGLTEYIKFAKAVGIGDVQTLKDYRLCTVSAHELLTVSDGKTLLYSCKFNAGYPKHLGIGIAKGKIRDRIDILGSLRKASSNEDRKKEIDTKIEQLRKAEELLEKGEVDYTHQDATYRIAKNHTIIGGLYNSIEEAGKALREYIDSSKGKPVSHKFQVRYWLSGHGDHNYLITLKGNHRVIVRDGLTKAEAYEQIKDQEGLERDYAELTRLVEARRKTNEPRQGKDWREGNRDVSADEFIKAFGFRGVQFGNWETQEDRQRNLNEAYDALMDLASSLGVSPETLSLNGSLGMAFGARGGGKANAHYEPGEIVINLTKTKGAGSLAHEWWHALDNFFGKAGKGEKARDVDSDMATTSSMKDMESVRPEVRDAYNELIKAIRNSEYGKRQAKIAMMKSDYWGTPVEMSARALERYMIDRMAAQGISNDYLVNITPEEMARDANGKLGNYVYPTAEEMKEIGKVYQHFFDTLQEKVDEETGMKVLYDKASGTSATVTEEEAALRDAVSDVLRNAGIEVIDDEVEGQRVLDMAKGHARMMSVDEAKAAVEKINAIKPTVVKDLGRRSRAEVKADYDRLQPVEKDGASIEFYHGVFGKAWHGEDSLFAKVVPWLHDILQNSVLAYSETDILAGEVRPDGTVHKEHFNIVAYHNYVGKVKIGDKDYYVRFTVQEDKVGNQGTHSFFVSDVSLYNNTAGDVTTDTKNHLGNTSANGIVDAKLKQFFDYAKGKGEKISFLKAYHGSAADFDAFDTMNHLSEGEGSQAFGAGTYVADQKGLGEMYAKINKRDTAVVNGKEFVFGRANKFSTAQNIALGALYNAYYGRSFSLKDKKVEIGAKDYLQRAIQDIRNALAENPNRSDAADYKEAERLIESGEVAFKRRNGVLYTVEVPDDTGKNYLDWDNPIDEDAARVIVEALYSKLLKSDEAQYLYRTEKNKAKLHANLEKGIYNKHKFGDIYQFISSELRDDKAASEFLHDLGYTGIKAHAAHNSNDARYKKNWNYVIFNDKDLKIMDKVRFFRTSGGEAYGFTVGGKIYIDPRIATSETPIHEYAHLWAEALRKANPKEWQNVVSLMKECKAVWEQVKREYPELTTDDEIADEVLAHYSGKRGAERLRAEMRKAMDGEKSMIKKAGIAKAFDALKEALKKAWKHISEDILHIHFTSADEVADKVMYDLLNKVKPGAHDQLAEERAEIERRAKEDGTWMKAPNGKKSNLTEEQWVTVRTRQFKDWFGDWEEDPENSSQAVDENGEPLVVYHGTEEDFNIFELFEETGVTNTFQEIPSGSYMFTPDEYAAEQYGEVRPMFLNTRDMLDLRSKESILKVIRYMWSDASYYGPETLDPDSEETVVNGLAPLIKDDGRLFAMDFSDEEMRDEQIEEKWHFIQQLIENYCKDRGYDGYCFNDSARGEECVSYGVFLPNQIKSATDNVGTFDETNPDIRYQFVGEKGAASADRAEEATTRLDNLSVARKMEEAGKDAHNIKMATGWERGADEKWRYEIPDFRNIDPRGNIDFFKNNPDYKRYFDLIAKSNKAYFFNGEFTKEEESELSALDRKLHGLEYQTFRNPDKLTLKDYMDAPELFKAYPQLRNLPVKIEALPDNTEGAYTYQDGAPVIKISKGIMDSALAGVTIPFKRVMAHEIQHAIQLEEGFAKGGSIYSVRGDIEDNVSEMRPSYDWTSREGSKAIRLKNAASKLEFAKKIAANPEDYVNDPLTLVRLSMNGHKPLETIKKMPDADKVAAIKRLASNYWWEVVDDFANGLGEQVGMELPHNPYPEDGSEMSDEQWEKVNKASRNVPYADEMIAALRKRASAIEDYVDEHGMSSEEMSDYLRKNRALERRDDTELYASLAGEVEARNAARRVAMTDEQRRRNLASDTEDVSREDQIYLYDSFGIARSEEANDNGKAHYRDGEESDIEDVNKRFNKELERYEKGETPVGTRFDLGMPSKELESAGFPYLPISMRASLLSRKAGTERHPFEASDLRDLVKAMQKPIVIFKYSKENMRNLIVDVMHGGKHFLVGVTLDYKAGDIEVNSVSGLFPKESHEWIKWIQDGKAIRIDQKKKVLDLIDSLRTNPAESERIGLNLSSAAKIVEDFENPVIKGENVSDEEENNSMKDAPTTPAEAEEGDVLYREVDDEEQKRLDNEPTVKVYRAMQEHDGKLYPPMSGRVREQYTTKNGVVRNRWVWRAPIAIGKWERSEEHPEMANEDGTFTLDKGNGSTINAAYNPYIHTSHTPINDQFSSAWNRPELVTVEVEVPESELTSGYRAEKAKDATGEVEWKSGPVGREMAAQGKPRMVILSRWDKPIRIVPVEEVADEYAKRLQGTGISVPFNTVPPALREALVARGVEISEPEKGNAGAASRQSYEEWLRGERRSMEDAVRELAQKLHLNNVEIVTEPITVRDKNGKVHRPKGYFNPRTGKITISIANNADADDAVSTLLHEAVAHYGLRQLLGENFNTFLDNVYENAGEEIRGRIDTSAKEKYKGDTRTATEEYLASLAEKENFEEARKKGIWDKIKELFKALISRIGVKLKEKLTDNDLRYMLWRSYNNLKDGGKGKTMLQEAEDAAKRYELGIDTYSGEYDDAVVRGEAKSSSTVNAAAKGSLWGKHDMVSLAERAAAGEDPELLFRDSVGPQDETARKIYDKRADAALMKIREAWQDSMINVKNLQDAVLEARGENIEDYEDAYMQENNLHGVSRAESECFTDNFYKPLLEEVNKAAKGWYDRRTGRITIVAGNHTSVADAESTLLHEAVAHYGLRQLLGDTVNLLLAAAAYNFKRAKRSRFCTFLSNST